MWRSLTRQLRKIHLDSVGRIVEIWRYPVSSVGGERLASASLTAAGVTGDRLYGLIDFATGLPVAPEKDVRWRKALLLSSKWVTGDFPIIVFPNKEWYPLNDRSLNAVLSDYFGFATAVASYDRIESSSTFPLTKHRHHHFPIHLLTTASLNHLATLGQIESINSRRFRPTVLIEPSKGNGFLEKDWIGRSLRLGEVDVTAQDEAKRCGMTFIPQPGLADDPEILRSIVRHNKRNLGIYCSIESIGTIRLDDELSV